MAGNRCRIYVGKIALFIAFGAVVNIFSTRIFAYRSKPVLARLVVDDICLVVAEATVRAAVTFLSVARFIFRTN